MTKITDIIAKAQAISLAEDERLREQFHRVYKETKKEFTFNALWRRNWTHGMDRILYDHEWRLIMEVGDIAKIKGPRGERILAMGTEFGTVLLYSMYDDVRCNIQYMTTVAFARAWANGYQKKCEPTGYLNTRAPHFLDEDFFAHVSEIAEMEEEAGRPVGDGIPKYVRPETKRAQKKEPVRELQTQ